MEFQGTSEAVLILLLIALGFLVLRSMVKREMESNLPLLFYCALMVFMSSTGRAMDAPLVLCGLVASLVLRFEFMNRAVTNAVWVAAVSAVIGIMLGFVSEVFTFRY